MPVARKSSVPSVIFFKRLIAATLAFIILSLGTLSVLFGVRLHRTGARLDEYVAEEEAERLRNLIPPEKEKPEGERDAMEILAENKIIAHALGSVDGLSELNCLEGFLVGYEAGIRVFETDLRMTSDGRVVLRHDWRPSLQEGFGETYIPTLEEFLATPILGQYTPLSFQDLLLLMEQYPDICIVTDTKFLEPEAVVDQFKAMVYDAQKLGLSYLFDRMAVQVYSPTHFNIVESVHHFPHYIYTLYQDYFEADTASFRRKANFAQENGIEAITMWSYLWEGSWKSIADYRDLKIYVHTVNEVESAEWVMSLGVDAIYTDFLTPADLEG